MWLFGNYGRLSKDEKGEKLDSVEIQLNFNAQYLKDNNLGVIVDTYFDDDTSGVYFDREDLDRLKEDIENKRINAIIVKDLSRLGRSNAKTLLLLEYLEERGIRLVSINDNYDSIKDNDDIIGIKTWYNERYVKDLSVKIRSNLHQKKKNGEFVGKPPYGYKKEYKIINNKMIPINILIVDEVIRPIIIEIFELYVGGLGYRKIAQHLQEKGYPTPSQYKNQLRRSSMWSADMIKTIISNRAYCGDTVQGTMEKISYKTKKVRRRPEESWYIKKNTHEPIIARETWELANEISNKRATENGVRNKNTLHLFSGFLECGACGKFLCARNKNNILHYICSKYFHYGKKTNGCTNHYIRNDQLELVVLEDIKNIIGSKNTDDILLQLLNQSKPKNADKTKDSLVKELNKYKQQLKLMYEDRLNGIISVDVYMENSKDTGNKITNLENQIKKISQESEEQSQIQNSIEKLKATFQEILDNGRLNRGLLERSIRRIFVFMPGDIDEDNVEEVSKKIKADRETVERLKNLGGLFISYKL